ncbi:septal ring lytic transglycosylase RlpA family protein [Desulfovibrio sp. ZJ369]|uniref:septal ring lytic transglycosylase RlpA family protein n=1 Tax=Desulfovibrio sp. ZJ369 TaxID=2709793 RepID=UPI0013ED3DA2|nr:septal ring lytic transglycosylase RlpA family protein [Desulfovibrio sp. ZJ369]
MKYSRWLSMGAALALCLALAAPMNADAASQSAPPAKSRKSGTEAPAPSVKKSKKAASSVRKNKAAVSKSKKAHKKQRSKATAKKQLRAKAKTARKSADNRAIWLKRAQGSELLTGKASWYGRDFHGGSTASGVDYDMYTFTAAHRTLPIGTVVKVTDQDNGKSVMVCVTDRGPYVRGRIIDLSYAAARQLDLSRRGVGKVDLEVVSDESGTPLKADQAYYVRYVAAKGHEKVGPFRAFADAAAMHEALRQVHPEAEVVLGSSR